MANNFNALPQVMDPNALNAVNQLNKDRELLEEMLGDYAQDVATLKEFLESLGGIEKSQGSEVAFMKMMSQGFSDIDMVKNDNFALCGYRMNVCTDYEAIGSLSESYLNDGASKEGISLSETRSLKMLLQVLQGAKDDKLLDGQTGRLISSSADTLMNTIFDPTITDPNQQLIGAQGVINSNESTNSKQQIGDLVKTWDNSEDEITSATSGSSQVLQTQASVASKSYESYLDVENKSFTNWSSLIGDINRKMVSS